ncbi:hypothetical protein B0H13DRAFT_2323209 [Mycena leptocephala]|nr:hypothetical protein B0H13DRAFT_2323209 [Mycena leptocephala]
MTPLSLVDCRNNRRWDSRILRKLPRALANSFPAMFIYRSAISESAFMFMRSCLQSGMGAKHFSDALRVRHPENCDKLQLSYLSRLARAKTMQGWLGKKFESFLPFYDQSRNVYHGIVPSSQWLRDLFDKSMDLHAHDFDQALLQNTLKVNGEQVIIALLTVTNEKGEIRVCNLVATNSHSQFELALNRMRESLEQYGHDPPAIFHTDNMSDKGFLERCFPALCNVVVAVGKYSHLKTRSGHPPILHCF